MNKYFQNSLVRESPEMDRIRTAVKEAGIFVVLAYSERFNSSLYIAQVSTSSRTDIQFMLTSIQSYIDQTGTIVYHRRKTKPTHVERAYWGDGQADSLTNVVTTPFGKIGALNCWEHTQPLLRYHEYSQDVDIHVASWPCIFELPEGGVNWQYHISSEASSRFSQVMAMEGACFLLVCTQILTEKNRGKDRLENFPFAKAPGGGFSMIFGPDGRPLVEPLGAGVEGILYAEVDLEKKALAKQNVDVVGHYSRPDLLSLKVNLKPATQIQYG